MPDRVPCRCLLAESFPAMEAVVAEYVATLPEALRTEEEIYRQRLAACQACDLLRDGTCALCGCYVEARAAKAPLPCPHVPPRWER